MKEIVTEELEKYLEIISGMHVVDFVKNGYAGNITQNNVSARLLNLKTEKWCVPLVQEDNYEGKGPEVGRYDDHDDKEEKEVEDHDDDNNHFVMFGALSNAGIAISDSVNSASQSQLVLKKYVEVMFVGVRYLVD